MSGLPLGAALSQISSNNLAFPTLVLTCTDSQFSHIHISHTVVSLQRKGENCPFSSPLKNALIVYNSFWVFSPPSPSLGDTVILLPLVLFQYKKLILI